MSEVSDLLDECNSQSPCENCDNIEQVNLISSKEIIDKRKAEFCANDFNLSHLSVEEKQKL